MCLPYIICHWLIQLLSTNNIVVSLLLTCENWSWEAEASRGLVGRITACVFLYMLPQQVNCSDAIFCQIFFHGGEIVLWWSVWFLHWELVLSSVCMWPFISLVPVIVQSSRLSVSARHISERNKSTEDAVEYVDPLRTADVDLNTLRNLAKQSAVFLRSDVTVIYRV